MKALGSKIPRTLQTGSRMVCADNTGARVVEVVSVDRYHGVRRRQPKLGLGDVATVSVKKGTPDMRKKLVKAVVVRQKKEFRRPGGLRVSFEENAMVLINDNGDPRGTEIKGPVAREVAARFPKIASMATIII
ncbi:MAG: 50S ribosomal protein L14P [Methanomicrobiales archaeon 53_19]|jgi:large subunit ribosomal protein L14|uniref:50S ribosomal protein L14 n=1 Tax=Methanocalculus sp. TaxID=2004547 RepID=UPI0007491909|nr:50S ribosomal protein L14 [Methanocalculus sp.]KUK67756.1 MAG: 50S ribosomal protein L14P [Methanocalculus sp. 52_23]KUL03814.1 MAG: 50S ribosomal protein L14P [Methanomicrobiales archaeon 53_19]HIJ07490.1 50S ribosomal protein L14 [Methanocalculus sp.]